MSSEELGTCSGCSKEPWQELFLFSSLFLFKMLTVGPLPRPHLGFALPLYEGRPGETGPSQQRGCWSPWTGLAPP
jgi:hypothetical protein